MAHKFNFKQVFSAELKAEIIEKRTRKYVEKFGVSERDARKRAKSEMMNKRDYSRFARVADYICTTYNIPTDTDNISISTNRYGGHSWYIKYDGIEFRLSDHESNNTMINTVCIYPLSYSIEYIRGLLSSFDKTQKLIADRNFFYKDHLESARLYNDTCTELYSEKDEHHKTKNKLYGLLFAMEKVSGTFVVERRFANGKTKIDFTGSMEECLNFKANNSNLFNGNEVSIHLV